MAARPTWQGQLKLSLVNCPTALCTATTSTNDVRFHLINPDTNNRIRRVPTDPDTGPVERSDLVRGYEEFKDEYVLFDDTDFDQVKLASTKTISADRCVDETDIDRLYWADAALPIRVIADFSGAATKTGATPASRFPGLHVGQRTLDGARSFSWEGRGQPNLSAASGKIRMADPGRAANVLRPVQQDV